MNYFSIFSFLVLSVLGCKSVDNKEACDKYLHLSEAEVFSIPFVQDYERLIRKLGEPYEVRDSCTQYSIPYYQGYHVYSCLKYESLPGITFRKIDSIVFINTIDFKKYKKSFEVDQFHLSADFSLEDLEKLCPNALNRLRKGRGIGAIDEKYDYIYFLDAKERDRRPSRDMIEMYFENGKLATLIYDWQKSLTTLQWERYQEVKLETEDKSN